MSLHQGKQRRISSCLTIDIEDDYFWMLLFKPMRVEKRTRFDYPHTLTLQAERNHTSQELILLNKKNGMLE